MAIEPAMKHIGVNVSIIAVAIIFSVVTATWLGAEYDSLFHIGLGGNWIGDASAWQLILGFPLALIFFISLLFVGFGKDTKHRWLMGALALPALFELVFDFSHIYFPVALGLVGYGIGWGVNKVLKRA